MVVDDDIHVQDLVCRALQPAGLQVEAAPNLMLGLTMAHRQRPDLVILDALLPGSTPQEVASAFAPIRLDGTAILLVTALGRDGDAMSASVGASYCVHKPFDLRELLSAVVAVLNRGTGGNGPSPPQGRPEGPSMPR